MRAAPLQAPLRPPSPVHVGPQVLGGVVVDHQLHALHVDATSRGVCADEAVGTRRAVGPARGGGTDTPGRSTLPGHSQLNLSLLKLLQNCPPPARPEAGGEFGHRHTPEGLDQQEEPVWEKPWSGLEPASLLPDPHPRASPVRVLAGVGEAENPREVHVQDEMQDNQRLGTQAAGHVVVLQAQHRVGRAPAPGPAPPYCAPHSP